MKKQKKILENVYHGILQNISNHPYVCCYPDCSNRAINSHILQQSKILSQIQESGFLYEFLPKRHFDWENLNFSEVQEFKRVSVRNSNSYKAFCAEHDGSLFRDIEDKEPLDFSKYRIKFLFLFKMLTILNRRKEILKDFQERAINSEIIKNHEIGAKLVDTHKWTLEGIDLSLSFSKRYIDALYIDIENIGIESYDIEVYSFDAKPCYCCRFSLCMRQTNLCFTLIFPYEGQLRVLIAKLKNEQNERFEQLIKKWSTINEEDLNKELTVSLLESEYLGFSPSLYFRNCENGNLIKFYNDKYSAFTNAYKGNIENEISINYTLFD